jgi:hypothetical protein
MDSEQRILVLVTIISMIMALMSISSAMRSQTMNATIVNLAVGLVMIFICYKMFRSFLESLRK